MVADREGVISCGKSEFQYPADLHDRRIGQGGHGFCLIFREFHAFFRLERSNRRQFEVARPVHSQPRNIEHWGIGLDRVAAAIRPVPVGRTLCSPAFRVFDSRVGNQIFKRRRG
jgi:hypothetical protein